MLRASNIASRFRRLAFLTSETCAFVGIVGVCLLIMVTDREGD